MNTKAFVITAATCAAFSLSASSAFAWGCSRSCSASTRGGGTTVTGREGNSYSTAHANAAGYGGAYHGAAYGGAYHGAAYGGAVYHTGGYGAAAYGGCYSTGVGVGVVAAPVYAPAVAAAAAVYHPYTPCAAGVYHRTVAFRR